MPKAIVEMPFRKELRAESDHCLVSDTASETTPDEHNTVNHRLDANSLTACEKRLH